MCGGRPRAGAEGRGRTCTCFGPDCPEAIRHRLFGGTVMDYNARKEATIRAIYDRLFRAYGML
ncbi:hypothetical protein GCM10017786_03710 [Amycolatopsis deserti]|uniref:Uncharacterized protein n=1 Tax=Amycolatopsis deserti TaxID=185696 RepID=A0ABQ3IBQ7_9PSEU|nr:hypothetical protein [Amycolatopsis deserti]GHE77510.1 hypothetical protein GCM10017786_03710 [Amycolatopsis deserti]